jgi:hypothetical protein
MTRSTTRDQIRWTNLKGSGHGGCGRLARSAEPIDTFLEAALFEMVRRPAFAEFLTRRSSAPEERGQC